MYSLIKDLGDARLEGSLLHGESLYRLVTHAGVIDVSVRDAATLAGRSEWRRRAVLAQLLHGTIAANAISLSPSI